MSNRVRTYIVVVVTIVWVLNFLALLAIPSYEAPPEINSIFMAVMGTVLATAPIVGGRRQREEEEPSGENSQTGNPDERQT